MRLSLLLILVLASPLYAQNKVKGITLPGPIVVNETDYQKRIVPRFDNPETVLNVEWDVVSTGKSDPKPEIHGTGKDSYITVNVPAQGEALEINCYARLSVEPYLTKIARTTIEWGESTPPPSNPPGGGQPPQQLPNPPGNTPKLSNTHLFLVTDGLPPNAQLKQIMESSLNALGTGNAWWQMSVRTAADVTALKNSNLLSRVADAQGKLLVKLPVVIVVDNSKKPAVVIGNPVPVQITGNAQQDSVTIASAVTSLKK